MKKISLVLFLMMFLISSCGKKEVVENTNENITKDAVEIAEKPVIIATNDKEDAFTYTGEDKYLKAITEEMVENVARLYESDYKKAIEIPTPIVVKVDDSDKNDIKVYGNFWIFGYSLKGTTFHNENGGEAPGCYHLKEEEDGSVVFVSKEIAEDGSNFTSSLKKIASDDEELYNAIVVEAREKLEEKRVEYVKMYAKSKGLNITSIKDYGWPIIIFDTATNEEFVYDFYNSYMEEIRQEDVLNDMVSRIDNLKSKYMNDELIVEKDEETMDVGADMIISAQDATDNMINTLKVETKNANTEDEYYEVTYSADENDEEAKTVINVKLMTSGKNRYITAIDVVNP